MAETPRSIVERFWVTLYRRDWDAIAQFFGPTSTYTDMATPADDVAVGPEQILKRLRWASNHSRVMSTNWA